MSAATHIIRLQRIEAILNGPEPDGLALPGRLSALCRDVLPPALDRALQRFAPAEGHLFIERLEIDAGEVALDRLEQELPEAVRIAVEKAVREVLEAWPASDSEPISGGQSASFRSDVVASWEAFWYFLETGRLPWAYRLPTGLTWEDVALQALATMEIHNALPGYRIKIARPAVRSRLVLQFSPAFLDKLTDSVAPDVAEAVRLVLAALRPHFPQGEWVLAERIVWENALAQLAEGSAPPASPSPERAPFAPAVQLLAQSLVGMRRSCPDGESVLREAVRRRATEPWVAAAVEAVSAPRLAEAKTKAAAAAETVAEPVTDTELHELGLLLDHAGTVLLHPFLPQFFRALGVADGAALIQPDRSLHLLHFLATGNTPAPEHELTFAKILCGIPLGRPVEGHIELTDNEVAESLHLLETVIRYWDALKGTSPDGLREAFLRRPGKLNPSDDGGWVLQMEKQTPDILLQQLPWGIGMVQLPWMPALLRVEWAE